MIKHLSALALLLLLIPDADAQQLLNYTTVKQYVNDLVYDSVYSGQILLSIPGKDNVHGNSIGYFNPDSAKLSQSYFIGSEPNDLELTPNSKYLYVAMDGAATVKKFDVDSRSTVQTFGLGSSAIFGIRRAANISCAPDNDSVVAITLKGTPTPVGAAVYRNGVQLHDTIGYPGNVTIVHFKDPAALYGYDNNSTGSAFFTLAVDNNGVRNVATTNGLVTSFAGDFHIKDNRAIFDNGAVVDLSTTPPSNYGVFNLSNPLTGYFKRGCYDRSEDLWCFASVSSSSDSVYIQRFHANTLLQKDLLVAGTVHGSINKIICWGDSARYAICTDAEELIITNGFGKRPAAAIGGITGNERELRIYPNPASDIIHLDYRHQAVDAALFDMTGRLVLAGYKTLELPLKGLPCALYLLQVKDADGRLIGISTIRKD